jgi:uncharacterized protein YdhG (YjbR/CyaY superfamily)
MAKTNYQSVDQYLAAQPEAVQPTLQRVRSVLRRALPGADEVISYQIPAYKLHGRVVIYFAGWKDHYSLYPVSGSVAAAFARELAPYEVNNKGTARFPYVGRIPTKLIESIAKLLAKNTLEGTRPTASKPRKPAASKPRKSARPAKAIERKRSA